MEPPDDLDRRLTEMLGAAPAPDAPPNMEARVHQLIRRRRTLQRTSYGIAAAAVVGFASFAGWEYLHRPATGPGPIVVAPTQPVPVLPDTDLADLLPLIQPPPIAVVVPAQKKELAYLNQVSEGGRK